MSFVDSVIDKFHKSFFWGRIFHTLNYCLQKELSDCETVLDIGCGPSSPLQYCSNIKSSVGVEPFKPYLEESKKKKIHTKYLNKKIEELGFPENSFDAVIMIEVLEHLPKKVGYEILKKAEKWARKKVIVTTPNGYFPMRNVDNNILQTHKSGWSIYDFKKIAYFCYGLAGVRFLYHNENRVKSMVGYDNGGLGENIKFRPKILFYFVNSLLQIFSYYFPIISFELMAIKNKNNEY